MSSTRDVRAAAEIFGMRGVGRGGRELAMRCGEGWGDDDTFDVLSGDVCIGRMFV